MSSWTQHGQPPNDSQQAFSSSVQQQQSSQPSIQRQQVGVGGGIGHANPAQFTNQTLWSSNTPQQSTHQPPQANWNQNVYPQHNAMGPPVQHNNWLQGNTGHLQSTIPTSGYFLNQDIQNYSQQQQHQQTQQYSSIQQACQPPQQFREHIQHAPDQAFASANTAILSYPRQDNAQEAVEYKTNNNNDGWGDWDWNDNNIPPHHQQQQQKQQRDEQEQNPTLDNIPKQINQIEDSFRKEEDDTWNWGHIEQANQELNNLTLGDQFQNSQQPPPQKQIEKRVSLPPITKPASIATPPPQTKPTVIQPVSAATQQQTVNSTAIAFKPSTLPLNENTQSSDVLQNSSNIPSPVYVSQAKPVSKPPRQYASLLGTSGDSVNALGRPATPPHAFQNRTEPQPGSGSDIMSQTSTATLPPPMIVSSQTNTTTQNPFKRAGLVQHHRANIIATPLNSEQSNVVIPPSQFYVNPPPPPQDFANPSVENHEVVAPDNSEVLDENQEIAPNNDRNEYLQTSHLSEIGSHVDPSFNIEIQEPMNEADDFPPPGLSRLVLGQPENESRQILGTETENNLNIERQADGEDTDPLLQRTTFMPSTEDQNNVSQQIDITSDRNLYLVPGESDVNEQRVVTGTDIGLSTVVASPAIQGEQREVELDGENIEDQHQLMTPIQATLNPHRSVSPTQANRDMPLDGASSFGRQVQGSKHTGPESESNLGLELNAKDLSNVSTGNDESDQREPCYGKPRRSTSDEIKKRRQINESKEKRYESEESELSSERERHRYRESSVRSDRDRDRDNKDRKRRDKRDRDVGGERERDRYRGDEHENRYRQTYYRERDTKDDRGSRYGSGRYDLDSKYETESSARHERRRRDDRNSRGDRIDREAYEDYRRYRKYNVRGERDNYERRGGPRSDGDRSRGERDYRDERDSRRHKDHREKPRTEYEEYRKTSSRNARESDIEKDSRLREKDPRYAHHGMYSGYPSYGYDPYAAYYYEQMVRTNPQAYSEWYKKYYGQSQASESITNDGRESVHSGRSSANNEKDRYSTQHHPHISFTNDYHGHFMQSESLNTTISSSLNSTLIESQQQRKQGNSVLKGGPSVENSISGTVYYAPTARPYYARSEYSEIRDDNMSLNLADASHTKHRQDPQRLTPFKFANEHPVISLGPGLMVAVKPKYSQNGISNVVKIFKMGANDATNKLFQSFPGPLVRGLTHKKTIIEFCEDQIRLGPFSSASSSRQNSANNLQAFNQTYKPSFTLIWNLLILLLRQNGVVVGTDIAELLIKNQQQFPYEGSQLSSLSDSNRRNSQVDEENKSADVLSNHSEQEDDGVINDGHDESDDVESKTFSLTEVEITEKFRYHLLYGNVNEALDWAAENNLWGHALFLASKMDRRSHANVMMKFANKLSLNDPLQTLYQLMSGRTPSSVTSVQDERWGDWRPHLAMILSNTSQKPELDRKAITTLGDSLFNRGDLYAAHFCYLMAQVGFSKYPDQQNETMMTHNSVRLVLLGSSHHKEFEEFATNESIMMTEVYEYACSLNDEKFSLVEFQPFKFLLATRMLDYGYQLKCLMYMEQISLHIQRDPSKYTPTFINQVYELADRLKYYDPVLEKSMDEVQQDGSSNYTYGAPFEEQKWLQTLRSLAVQYVPTLSFQDLNKNQQNNQVIDQQFSEITRQCNELNLPYTNNDNSTYDDQFRLAAIETQNQSLPENLSHIMPSNEQQYSNLYVQNDAYHMQTHAGSGESIYYSNGYQPSSEVHQQQIIDTQQQMQFDHPPNPEYEQTNDEQQKIYDHWRSSGQAVMNNEEPDDRSNSKSTSISDNSDSVSSTIKSDPNPTIHLPKMVQLNAATSFEKNLETDTNGPAVHLINPLKQQNQQSRVYKFTPTERNSKTKHNNINNRKLDSLPSSICESKHQDFATPDTARPTISMPNSISQKSGFYDDTHADETANLKNDGKKGGRQTASSQETKNDSKNQTKSSGQISNQNSGWFGGIWNKLSLKPKNQMILPDDKNPTIVWDPEKKKWVNTDGDDTGEENLKPPPKMSGFMTKSQPNLPNPPVQQLSQQDRTNESSLQQPHLQVPSIVSNTSNTQTYSTMPSVSTMPSDQVKTSNLQSNMFKMQRNRTLKNSYVDVFNPSRVAPKQTEQILAPSLPSATVPSGGFLVPGDSSNDGSIQHHQQISQESTPQFYNPNQFGEFQQ